MNQVAATLLAFLDLPPRAPGDAPLAGIDARRRTPVDYSAYYHPASPVPSAAGGKASEEALEKLRALGYVGVSPGRTPSTGGTPGSTRTAGSYANESLILRLEGRPAEAMAAAESALRLDPDQANALWALSDLTQGEAATRDRSDDLLVHAVASGLADGPRYLAARADEYRRAGQGSRAVRLLDAAVAARRSDPQVWRLRGRQRVDQGACVAARDDFQRALSLEPDDRASLASLGLALLCLGDEAGAREALGKSAASLGEAHRVLAQGALARGDVARAEREARAAMGERESEAAATLLLAEIDLRRDQPREALRRLDAIRSQVRLPGVKPLANLKFLRGEALARMDRTAEAEAAFREEIRLFPESIPAYQRLALVLALQDRGRDEVRGLLEAMYEASPRRETASLAARTLQTIGDKEGAIAWQKRMVVPGGRR